MIRAHKIRIYPNKEQEVYLKKSCGVSRFTYNWGLAKWKELHEAGEKTSWMELNKLFNSVKENEFIFVTEVSSDVPTSALSDLGTAFKNFFRELKKSKVCYPKFKKKGQRDSFYIKNASGKIIGKELYLPKIKTAFKCAEELRFTGKIMSYTISRDVDRWYVSVAVDTDEKIERLLDAGTTGIDLGVKTLATFSDGTVFETKRFYKLAEKRLARAQRRLAKKVKGSNNRAKTKLKLAKIHRKVRLARKDYLHQVSHFATTRYTTVVLEDLNVSGMVKNRRLAKAVSNMGFYTFRTMVENKAKMTDTKVVFADRFYPSSKLCSNCGHKKDILKLSERVYKCESCGFEKDRDLNAAINLEKLGTCCPDVKPAETDSLELSMKQETLSSSLNNLNQGLQGMERLNGV